MEAHCQRWALDVADAGLSSTRTNEVQRQTLMLAYQNVGSELASKLDCVHLFLEDWAQATVFLFLQAIG
jgi:hypothetical protein